MGLLIWLAAMRAIGEGLNSLDRFNGPDPAKRDPVLPVVRTGDGWRVGGNNLRDKG